MPMIHLDGCCRGIRSLSGIYTVRRCLVARLVACLGNISDITESLLLGSIESPETGSDRSMATVPVEYFGVWKRTLLKTKSGTHDTTSEAYWLQTGHLHCDLRVPTDAQSVSSIPLADCSDDELHALASQYAFAGHTKVY